MMPLMTSSKRDINVVLKNANQFILHTVQIAVDAGSATNSILPATVRKRKQKPHASSFFDLFRLRKRSGKKDGIQTG